MPSYADWAASQTAAQQQHHQNGDLLSSSEMELDGRTQESVLSDLRQQRVSSMQGSSTDNEAAMMRGPSSWDRDQEMPKTTILLVIGES